MKRAILTLLLSVTSAASCIAQKSTDPISQEQQQQAEQAVKEHYKGTKFYLLKSFGELYWQNDDPEFRAYCGTDKEIIYSLMHTYFLNIDKVEEFVQFDKDLNILAILDTDSMGKFIARQLENSFDPEELFKESGLDETVQNKDIEGVWVIKKYQNYGSTGLTNQMSDMMIGDTVEIGDKIYMSMEENEFTKALGMSREKCDLNILNSRQITDIKEFFTVNYTLEPNTLELDVARDKVFYIKTDCKDKLFKEIIYRKNKKRLFLIDDGVIYILEKA